jgi:hypothetical protein
LKDYIFLNKKSFYKFEKWRFDTYKNNLFVFKIKLFFLI